MTTSTDSCLLPIAERPTHFARTKPDGAPLKSLPQALLERRATSHFAPDEVPEEILDTILRLATQAPQGYNLQPGRFIVVRDPHNRERLQRAAYGQPKIAEAPVVVIALGMKEQWRSYEDAVFDEMVRRGVVPATGLSEFKEQAGRVLGNVRMDVWVNRSTMIVATSLMLLAEAYGYDTAPMEGFEEGKVKQEFGIPEEAEVVLLLAIGRMKPPDKPYPGRFPLECVAFREYFGDPWNYSSVER